MFPWARDKQQGLGRHLPHKEDEAQKGIETYLTSHSKAALRLGWVYRRTRQEDFLWSEKEESLPR